MAGLPNKQAKVVDFRRAPVSLLKTAPLKGSEKRAWRERRLSTSHADLALRETTGKKLPILLLHGGGLCKDVFDRQLESSLGASHRMIAIDWPGHGASGDAFDPDRTYRIEGLADLALEVLERLDIDHAVVVGASLGAWVGLQLAQIFPGLLGLALSGIELTDAAPSDGEEIAEFALPQACGRFDDFLRRALGDLPGAAFASAAARADVRAMERLRADLAANRRDLWPSVDTPIMIVNGAEGGAPDAARDAQGRPTPLRYAIPHAGPAPYLQVPEVYNHLLQRFAQRKARRERQLLASPALWYGG